MADGIIYIPAKRRKPVTGTQRVVVRVSPGGHLQ